MAREAVIVGVGDVPLKDGKVVGGGSVLQVQARAAKAALDDARIPMRDVDGLLVAGLWGVPGPGQLPTVTLGEYLGIHPRFADSLLNAAFASDAAHLMGAARAALWIHGHMHNGSDYCIDGTRVLCNPRGYGRDGVNENPEFDPGFMIEIDRGGKVTTRHADGWQAQPQPT